jgi:hypothetical protein
VSIQSGKTFAEMGHTDESQLGKRYGIVICDSDRKYPNLSTLQSFNLQIVKDLTPLASNQFIAVWDDDVKKIYFDDYEIKSISLSWSFVAILVKDSYVKVLTRSNLNLIKYLPKFSDKIEFQKGIELIQYDNQVLIYHIESNN